MTNAPKIMSLIPTMYRLCLFLLSCLYFLSLLRHVYRFTVSIAVLHTVVAGLWSRGQYPEGPATGHLGTGFFLVSLCL
jgi:hypothetical protein